LKERHNYETFYKWLIECGKCPFQDVCRVLPDKICEELTLLHEAEAAQWFLPAWGGENGMWMNGFIAPGCVIHNNALESTWKWLKQHATTKGGGSRHPLYMFVVKMCRHFTDQSKCAQHNLLRQGHPDAFPATVPIHKLTWQSVQEMQVERMQCFYVLTGDKKKFEVFRQGVVEAEGDNLFDKLRNVDKAHDPSLQCALFLTSKAISSHGCTILNSGCSSRSWFGIHLVMEERWRKDHLARSAKLHTRLFR